MQQQDWWRGAVIYQVYPRSFHDANGDGIGDLPGLLQKLGHIADLGVDAVWISPFFPSPMRDFGYDISDYTGVDPIFGTLADFDRVLARAHQLGLKVLIDQVWSHTSDQHSWFTESRQNRTNPKADWYVWADPLPDGGLPNNWLSVFGGSAWQWDLGREQYYLHNFLTSQPDLNWHNPEVREAIFDVARFWLNHGVDGFRLDVPFFLYHDQQLRDNPPRPVGMKWPDGFPPSNPFGGQLFHHNILQPENVAVLSDIRALIDGYPGRVMVGELCGGDDSIAIAGEYTAGDTRLHTAYTAALLQDNAPDAPGLRAIIQRVEGHFPDGRMCWATGNHDFIRVASRWHPGEPAFHRMLVALLVCLRGNLCIYQGEELGLPEADIPFERLQDPYGIAMYPAFKGRDGCRTPMPWDDRLPYAGFSTTEPWLPVEAAHLPLAVNRQLSPGSMLSHYKAMLALRRAHPALRHGTIRLLGTPDPVVAFERVWDGERVHCRFNLSNQPAMDIPAFGFEIRPVTG